MNKSANLDTLRPYLDTVRLAQAKPLLAHGIHFVTQNLTCTSHTSYPQLRGSGTKFDELNQTIQHAHRQAQFSQVCKTPLAFCREIIQLKQASILRDLLILSLASKEPIHVLLICDETIQSRVLADTLAQAFEGQAYDAPLTQLGPVAIGEHIERGLLAQNAQKLLVIDKFEKQTDKDALYKSMEYGVLTVQTDTGTKSMQADPKILALAHPIKDIFNARTLPQLKEQITLKDQDLAKFHCISIVRQPTLTKLHNSTIQPKTLTADDTKLLCEYISYVQEVETTLPKDYHDKIVNFITTLKEREKQFIAPISSRLVQGLVRLTLASAKLHLRDTVNAQDLKTSMDIVQAILEAV